MGEAQSGARPSAFDCANYLTVPGSFMARQ